MNNKKTISDLAQSPKTVQAISPEGQSLLQGEAACAATLPTEDFSTQVKAKSPRRKFTTEYKLKFLAAYEACDNSLARGELLRKEGLYQSRITAWRQQRDAGKFSKQAQNKTSNKMPCLFWCCAKHSIFPEPNIIV